LALARAGAGTDAAQRAGEVCRVQMVDVHLPTTAGRELLLSRYTEPEPELNLLLNKLKLELPAQPPPNHRRVRAAEPAVVPTFENRLQ
jgi:hypothetical protein